jgi:GNAT superfamily N-acetyltransferase
VDRALAALDTDPADARHLARERLFSLALADLRVPERLREQGVRCRPPRPEEMERLVGWSAAYHVETLGDRDGETLRGRVRENLAEYERSGLHWVLERRGEMVAYSAFNAALPDCVQVGGVFTPPPLRGRGYARAVVAGTLLNARERGVARSVLFTGPENHAAQSAYRALGYREVGEYGLVLFA